MRPRGRSAPLIDRSTASNRSGICAAASGDEAGPFVSFTASGYRRSGRARAATPQEAVAGGASGSYDGGSRRIRLGDAGRPGANQWAHVGLSGIIRPHRRGASRRHRRFVRARISMRSLSPVLRSPAARVLLAVNYLNGDDSAAALGGSGPSPLRPRPRGTVSARGNRLGPTLRPQTARMRAQRRAETVCAG